MVKIGKSTGNSYLNKLCVLHSCSFSVQFVLGARSSAGSIGSFVICSAVQFEFSSSPFPYFCFLSQISNKISIFFHSYCKTKVVSRVFLWNFAREISARLARIVPDVQTLCLSHPAPLPWKLLPREMKRGETGNDFGSLVDLRIVSSGEQSKHHWWGAWFPPEFIR